MKHLSTFLTLSIQVALLKSTILFKQFRLIMYLNAGLCLQSVHHDACRGTVESIMIKYELRQSRLRSSPVALEQGNAEGDPAGRGLLD